jgi:hypothetical protein
MSHLRHFDGCPPGVAIIHHDLPRINHITIVIIVDKIVTMTDYYCVLLERHKDKKGSYRYSSDFISYEYTS